MPALRHAPATAEEAAAILAEAARNRQRIVPTGSGSKLVWHHDPLPDAAGDDALVSTRQLTAGFAHYAGDLVATIPAGMTLAAANAALGSAGQWLPLDPSFADRATIGGVVATNDSGPRRYRHGATRDLIIGIEVALANGHVVKAGGRVVKNVAGYDLSRLFCGSHGSLGIITSATFKLAPLAAASRTVVATVPTIAHAFAQAQAIEAAHLTPSAVEFHAPHPRLLVRFESTASAAAHMAEATRALIAATAADARIVSNEEERLLWTEHDRLVWQPTATVVKLCVLPADASAVMAPLESTDVQWNAAGRIALGVFLIGLDGVSGRVATMITKMASAARLRGGHLSVLQAPAGVRSLMAPGTPASAAAIMRAVKQRFDPQHVLRRVPAELS